MQRIFSLKPNHLGVRASSVLDCEATTCRHDSELLTAVLFRRLKTGPTHPESATEFNPDIELLHQRHLSVDDDGHRSASSDVRPSCGRLCM